MSDQLQFRKHHRYFVRHLNSFPGQYSSLDSTRLTMLYFAVSGLDLLDEVEKVFDAEQKAKLIDWIYSLQLTSETDVPVRSLGVTDAGCSGFTAMAFDGKEAGQFIVESNLAYFWDRRELFGDFDTLPVPVVPSRPLPGALTRLPGYFRYDLPEAQLNHRNALVAKSVGKKRMKVWTVSQQSDTKTMEEFVFNINPDACTLKKGPVATAVDDEVRQLKSASESFGGEVWIRTRLGLLLKQGDSTSQVFRGHVPCFHEHPYLPEITICDAREFIWIGQPDRLSRVKNLCGITTKFTAPYSHPKFLFAANEDLVRLLDTRSDTRPEILYTVPEWYYPRKGLLETTAEFFGKDEIRHVEAVNGSERYCVLITTRYLIIVDSRYPGRHLLRIGHGFVGTVHYVETSPPIDDPQNGGKIYNVNLLGHTPPLTKTLSFYQHCDGLWSSLRPGYDWRHPHGFMTAFRMDTPGPSYKHLFPPVRSIATVNGLGDELTFPREIVLSALDDGSIWSEYRGYQRISEEEHTRRIDNSMNSIKEYVETHRSTKPTYFHDIDDELFCDRTKQKKAKMVVSEREIHDVYALEEFDPEMPFRRHCPPADTPVIDEIDPTTATLSEKATNMYLNKPPTLEQYQESYDHRFRHGTLRAGIDRNLRANKFESNDVHMEPVEDEENSEDELKQLNLYLLPGFILWFSRIAHEYDHANLAQTYSALLSLLVLGDDLSRVDRRAVLEAIRLAQRDDGCFWAQGPGSECDMRFVYCAVAICHLLGDFVTIDWTKLASFLRASFSYEGGFGQGPMDEGHGGSTYCAVAALSLGGKLWDGSVLSDKDIKLLTKWVLNKQEAGFHGRSGKPDDTCYAFWLGATLKILGAYHLCDAARIRTFLLSAQHNHMGGFAKLPEPGMHSDLLHSYFSLAALAIQGEPTLSVINPSANISQRTYERLMKLRFD
ncbi:unnamed protein product, partial [Mesorhabditis spiculigera]